MAEVNNANKIILAELSYKIVGSAFTVFNELGPGLPEKDYQKALAQELKGKNIPFAEQVYIPLAFKGVVLSKYFADFIINKSIILELKVVPRLGYIQAKQLLGYLRVGGYRLGILLYFTEGGVKYRRVLNSHY